MTTGQQLTIPTIAAGSGLIDKLQQATAVPLAELLNLAFHPLGGIGDLTFVTRLPPPRLSNRDYNGLFMDIPANISGMNWHLLRFNGRTNGVN